MLMLGCFEFVLGAKGLDLGGGQLGIHVVEVGVGFLRGATRRRILDKVLAVLSCWRWTAVTVSAQLATV